MSVTMSKHPEGRKAKWYERRATRGYSLEMKRSHHNMEAKQADTV